MPLSINITNPDVNIEKPLDSKLPWIEKYRPQKLKEIISHKQIIDALSNFIKKKTLPHILLHGPPGTAKTSTIRACVRELYGDYFKYMTLELNASDNKGIDTVRKCIKNFVSTNNECFLPDEMKPTI